MKRSIGITLALVLLVAGFGIGWAVRGAPTQALAASQQALTARDAAASANPTNGAQRYRAFIAAVAAKAGISASTLDTAIRDVAAERVAQAAESGRISTTKAVKIEHAIRSGTLASLLRHRHHRIAEARAHGRHPLLHWLRLIAREK